MVGVEFKGENSSEENTGVVVDFRFFGDFAGICSGAISREHVGFCVCVSSIVSELIPMLSFSPDGDFFMLPSEEVIAFSSNVSVSFVGWSFGSVSCSLSLSESGFSTTVSLFRLVLGHVLLKWVSPSQSLQVGR